MLEHFVIFGLMVYSLVFSGVFTLILLGISENEIIESLHIDLNVISREELRVLTLMIMYFIVNGILEAILVAPPVIILSFETIPYIIALISGNWVRR